MWDVFLLKSFDLLSKGFALDSACPDRRLFQSESQVSSKGGPVSSFPKPDGAGGGLILRHAYVCSGQDGVVVRAAHLIQLTARDCTLAQVSDDGVESSSSLMGGEGDVVCQSLQSEEVFVGGSFHLMV
ncbi:hypothetical protein E2C01_051810 [Portunus trituberculatus]|uniref:Uncharacterized protein n=1 Tax=Portunus trituberculatus TaxID=210409 RepID=A0A5B7GFW0_PORTR|nr:hypothetical protein [Portunus trituberculatus]